LASSGAKLGGSIDIYNTQTLTYTQVVTVPEPIDSVAWSSDGRYLAGGYSTGLLTSRDPNVQIWDATTYESLAAYNHAFSVRAVAWSPDSDILASGDSGAEASSVKLWNVSENRFIADLTGHTSLINTLAWSSKGDYLASGSWDNTVRLWEASSWQHVKTFEAPHYVNTVVFSPDGNLIAVGCASGEIIIWSIP
jgi:WD40 repeat protein